MTHSSASHESPELQRLNPLEGPHDAISPFFVVVVVVFCKYETGCEIFGLEEEGKIRHIKNI